MTYVKGSGPYKMDERTAHAICAKLCHEAVYGDSLKVMYPDFIPDTSADPLKKSIAIHRQRS